MSNHTPGPWSWYRTDCGAVAYAPGAGWLIENISEEDAALIARAPQLLAERDELIKALEEVIDAFWSSDDDNGASLARQIGAAQALLTRIKGTP